MISATRLWSTASLAAIVVCVCGAVAVSILSAEESCVAGSGTRLVLVDDLARLDGSTLGSLDTLYDGGRAVAHPGADDVRSSLASGHSPIVQGWAIDSPHSRTAAGVYATIDGTKNVLAMYGLSRPDVAGALHGPEYEKSGFQVALPASAFGPGTHTIEIRAISSDLAGYYLVAGPIRVVVREKKV